MFRASIAMRTKNKIQFYTNFVLNACFSILIVHDKRVYVWERRRKKTRLYRLTYYNRRIDGDDISIVSRRFSFKYIILYLLLLLLVLHEKTCVLFISQCTYSSYIGTRLLFAIFYAKNIINVHRLRQQQYTPPPIFLCTMTINNQIFFCGLNSMTISIVIKKKPRSNIKTLNRIFFFSIYYIIHFTLHVLLLSFGCSTRKLRIKITPNQ